MARVFLSYNHQGRGAAKTLADDIESLGHSVWFDQELSGGQLWWNQILARIRDCDVFVLVLNPQALDSKACARECGYAAALGKPIVPVLAAEGVSTNLLPPALSQIQYVDYRRQNRSAALRLARALDSIEPAVALPDPLPAPPEAPTSDLGMLADTIASAAPLTYEQQSALVLDLRRAWRNPETANDARALRQRLRRRHDVFAGVAEEIDDLLRGASPTTPVEPQIRQDAASTPIPTQSETVRQAPVSQHPRVSPRHKPKPRSRTGIRKILVSLVVLLVAAILIWFLWRAFAVTPHFRLVPIEPQPLDPLPSSMTGRPVLASVTLDPSEIVPGGSVRGTLYFFEPVRFDCVVSLEAHWDDAGIRSVAVRGLNIPRSVTVREGYVNCVFPIMLAEIRALPGSAIVIAASCEGVTRTARLTVGPPETQRPGSPRTELDPDAAQTSSPSSISATPAATPSRGDRRP